MSGTERIYLRMERPGFPCDIAGINLLEPSPEGALPFEAVRAVFDQRRHQSPLLTLMLAADPLGIGEDRWTQAESLGHRRSRAPPGGPRLGIWCPCWPPSWRCPRTRSTAAARCGRRGT